MSNHSQELDEAYQKKVVGLLDKVVRRTALSVDRELVLATPVGNPDLWKNPAPPGYVGGRARSNWLASINAPRTDAGENTERNSGDTVAAQMTNFKLSDTIFITNNVPYIVELNNGHSTQIPAGFVDDIVVRNRREASRVRGLISA